MWGSTSAGPAIVWDRIERGLQLQIMIKGLLVTSVGHYWCRASNSMGQDRKGVTITGNYNGISSN